MAREKSLWEIQNILARSLRAQPQNLNEPLASGVNTAELLRFIAEAENLKMFISFQEETGLRFSQMLRLANWVFTAYQNKPAGKKALLAMINKDDENGKAIGNIITTWENRGLNFDNFLRISEYLIDSHKLKTALNNKFVKIPELMETLGLSFDEVCEWAKKDVELLLSALSHISTFNKFLKDVEPTSGLSVMEKVSKYLYNTKNTLQIIGGGAYLNALREVTKEPFNMSSKDLKKVLSEAFFNPADITNFITGLNSLKPLFEAGVTYPQLRANIDKFNTDCLSKFQNEVNELKEKGILGPESMEEIRRISDYIRDFTTSLKGTPGGSIQTNETNRNVFKHLVVQNISFEAIFKLSPRMFYLITHLAKYEMLVEKGDISAADETKEILEQSVISFEGELKKMRGLDLNKFEKLNALEKAGLVKNALIDYCIKRADINILLKVATGKPAEGQVNQPSQLNKEDVWSHVLPFLGISQINRLGALQKKQALALEKEKQQILTREGADVSSKKKKTQNSIEIDDDKRHKGWNSDDNFQNPWSDPSSFWEKSTTTTTTTVPLPETAMDQTDKEKTGKIKEGVSNTKTT